MFSVRFVACYIRIVVAGKCTLLWVGARRFNECKSRLSTLSFRICECPKWTGWRYCELIEPEGERHADYGWPYGGAYDIYRETVDYKQIEKLSVWINNLPANGAVKCYLSPVRATPLVKAKIQNPRLIVGDRALLLPVTMQSGSYLEFNSPEDCKVFGPDGSFLQEVKIAGAAPILAAGVNQLRFECDPIPDLNPRVRLNVATFGTPLAQLLIVIISAFAICVTFYNNRMRTDILNHRTQNRQRLFSSRR